MTENKRPIPLIQQLAEWQVIEPSAKLGDRTSHTWKENLEVPSVNSNDSWNIVGASRRGRFHENEGNFREDAAHIQCVDGWILVAVADGAGSHHLSRVGSNLAVKTAVETMMNYVNNSFPDSLNVEKILEQALIDAFNALQQESTMRKVEFKDFATTLLLLMFHPLKKIIGVTQIGDGLVAAQLEDERIVLLGNPQSGEYAGQTCFLTNCSLDDLSLTIQVLKIEASIKYVFVMTNGVADDCYPLDENLPKLIMPMTSVMSAEDPSKDLLDLINYNRRGSFDDRTLVVVCQREKLIAQGNVELKASSPKRGNPPILDLSINADPQNMRSLAQTTSSENIKTAYPRKLKVFLCHASQDKPVVRDLHKRLSNEGWIDPWLDEEKILAGQGWEYEIEKAVESADVVIVLLSTISVNKEGYIQKEIRYALDIALEKPEGKIFIIPLRLDNCAVPRRIKQWQYVDCFPQKQDEAYKKILNSLRARANEQGINISESQLLLANTNVKDKPVDFGSIDIRRMPVYFLLECGDAMRGSPLESVEQGVQFIHNELLCEPQAVEQINISVITYSTYAQQIVPLTPVASFEMPSLTAGGIHNLGNALRVLCDCVNKDLVESTATKKGDHKARVFWITAHNPTDDWSAGLSYLNTNSRKINGIVALAVGENVDVTVPRHITPNVLMISDVTPGIIRQFFKMISASVATRSRPDDGTLLPPLPSGFQVTL